MTEQNLQFHISSVIIASLLYFLTITSAASLDDSASETLSELEDRLYEERVIAESDLESEECEVVDLYVYPVLDDIRNKIEEGLEYRREEEMFNLLFGSMKRKADDLLAAGDTLAAFSEYHTIIHNQRCPERIARDIVKIITDLAAEIAACS